MLPGLPRVLGLTTPIMPGRLTFVSSFPQKKQTIFTKPTAGTSRYHNLLVTLVSTSDICNEDGGPPTQQFYHVPSKKVVPSEKVVPHARYS